MKNSGSESGGNPDDVLDLVLRDSEVLGDVRDAVTGTEPVDEVLDAGTPMDDERLPKRAIWINDHAGGCVGRKLDLLSPAISAVADALEIPADDLSEMFLAGPYNGQQSVVVAGARVVEDQFGAVGVHTLGCEGVAEPELLAELGDRGPDALYRDPRVAQDAQHVGLSKADEGDGGRPASSWKDRHQPKTIAGTHPLMKRRRRNIEIGGALPKREQRSAHPIVVRS